MPALASHRKPRPRVRTTAPAVGLTTAALASVTLLSTQSAVAAPGPKPRVEDVQKKVDDLYRQAGTATQQYNQAKEASATQRAKVDALLDDVAERADKLNDARRTLGTYAAAQYRNGSIAPSATFFLADDPQSYFDQSQLMDRMTSRQQKAITDFRTQQAKAAKKRSEAVRSLETLTTTQATLRTSKQDVQKKLGEARTLLSKLTAEEKARLAEIERKKEAEAKRKAEELAKQQAEADREAEEAAKEPGAAAVRAPGPGPARTATPPPRRRRSSPSPGPRSASRTSGARRARPRTTAPGSPRPRGRRRGSTSRAPRGTRSRSAPGSPRRTCGRGTSSSSTTTSATSASTRATG